MNTRRTLLAATVTAVALSGCASLSGPAWTTLIDGAQGLDNWGRVGDANWRADAQAGVIVADQGKAGFLVSPKSYKNFEIYAEFYAEADTNSGIFIRCSDPKMIGGKMMRLPEFAMKFTVEVGQAKGPANSTYGVFVFKQAGDLTADLDRARIVRAYRDQFDSERRVHTEDRFSQEGFECFLLDRQPFGLFRPLGGIQFSRLPQWDRLVFDFAPGGQK